jgi:hypothetical protein
LLFSLKSPLIVDPIHNVHRLQLVGHLAAYLELSHKPLLASDRVLPAFHRLIHYGMGLQLILPRLLVSLAPFSAVDHDDVSKLYSTVNVRNTVGRDPQYSIP